MSTPLISNEKVIWYRALSETIKNLGPKMTLSLNAGIIKTKKAGYHFRLFCFNEKAQSKSIQRFTVQSPL